MESKLTKWKTLAKSEKSTIIVVDGVEIVKVGKLENAKTDEEKKDQDEERQTCEAGTDSARQTLAIPFKTN